MNQNIGSKCKKHQEQIITTKIEKYQLDSQYCSVCLSDVLKKEKCGLMHQIIIDIVKNELFKIQLEIKQLNKNQSIERLNDNVLLIGPKKGEQKHGDHYYQFNDGTKQYVYNVDYIRLAYLILIINKVFGMTQFVLQMNQRNIVKFRFMRELKQRDLIFHYMKKEFKQFLNKQQVTDKQMISFLNIWNLVQKDMFIEKLGLFNQLEFQGKIIKNCKIGFWQILYKGDICGGGNFDSKGQKIGQWTEVLEKYNDKSQIQYKGEYKNGIRTGKWITIFEGQEIGGGDYDEKEVKSGQWIELHDNYYKACQVTYKGEYKNGLRTGKWITIFEGQEIGGGDYDEKGVKSGEWIELHDNFWSSCQLKYEGKYKNGIRTEFWRYTFPHQSYYGGGHYDEKGVKQGKWIDIPDNYSVYGQVTYQGEYKNGIRTGKWITRFGAIKIGGGIYDEKGVKQGQWLDLYDEQWDYYLLTCQGQYKNGRRTGKWVTTDGGKEIGGGNYDENGVKQGKWIEPRDNNREGHQVIYQGEYKNGRRTGKWITTYKGQEIGGSNYDEKGVKFGECIDIHDCYSQDIQVTYQGKYKNGIKTGKWITTLEGQKIGGGNYDEKGVKWGQWIDHHEYIRNQCQVTYSRFGCFQMIFLIQRIYFYLNIKLFQKLTGFREIKNNSAGLI